MIRPTVRKASPSKPRVVAAGVPKRMPLHTRGPLVSNGIWFLLQAMPICSNVSSAPRPVVPSGVTSTSNMWLSVPPETNLSPSDCRLSAKA